MELIERYIHEVGRYLPARNRGDIQAELRSLLSDALEDSAGAQPNEAEVVAGLKKFGSPRSVAARYYPEGQYLIGPALYPLFQTITWIVIAAVLGSQVLAWVVAYLLAGQTVQPLSAAAGLVNSIPAAFGWVVVVFFILQRLDVRLDKDEAEWDPKQLPQIDQQIEIKRGERIVSIVFESFLLAVVAIFPERIGAYFFPGGDFFGNPVLSQYLVWVAASLLLSIALDIYLVWQGRWTTANRLAYLGSNLFSIAVLALLVNGHTAWLQAQGVVNLKTAIDTMTADILSNGQIVTMWAFWMGFSVALIVNVIETAVMAVRMVYSKINK